MKGCLPLSDEQVLAVLNSFQGCHALRDKALFMLGIKTGYRISELLSLRIKDIYQNGSFSSRVAVAKQYCKGKREGQSVPLHHEAKKAISEYLQSLKGFEPDDYLFKSQKCDNKAISRVQAYDILHKAFQSIGMTGKLGTHSMRKTFAKNIHKKLGNDLMKTQKALRHTDIRATQRYLSFNEEEIEQAFLE